VTARAATDVKLMAIHRRDFRLFYSHLPELREQVHREQTRRRELIGDALEPSGDN